MSRCVISPRLKKDLLIYAIAYHDKFPDKKIEDLIKSLWEKNPYEKNEAKNNYFFLETLSMIPSLIKSNIVSTSIDFSDDEFSRLTSSFKNDINIDELNDLVSKFENNDWLKNISNIVGVNPGRSINNLNKNENYKNLREEDADFIKSIEQDVLSQLSRVTSDNIPNNSPIFYNKSGNTKVTYKVDSKDGRVINTNQEELNILNIRKVSLKGIGGINSIKVSNNDIFFYNNKGNETSFYFKVDRMNSDKYSDIELNQILSDKKKDLVPMSENVKERNAEDYWFSISVYNEKGEKVGVLKHPQNYKNASKLEASIIKACSNSKNPLGILPFTLNSKDDFSIKDKVYYYDNNVDYNKILNERLNPPKSIVKQNKEVEDKKAKEERVESFNGEMKMIPSYLMKIISSHEYSHIATNEKDPEAMATKKEFGKFADRCLKAGMPIGIDGKTLYLYGTTMTLPGNEKMNKKDVVYVLVDKDGNEVKLKYDGSKLIISDDGVPIRFNSPFASREYTQDNINNIRPKLKKLGLNDSEIDQLNERCEYFIQLASRIRNGEKIMFNITGITFCNTSLAEDEFNYDNCTDVSDTTKIDFGKDGMVAKIGNKLYTLDNGELEESQKQGILNLFFDPTFKIKIGSSSLYMNIEQRWNLLDTLFSGGFSIELNNNEHTKLTYTFSSLGRSTGDFTIHCVKSRKNSSSTEHSYIKFSDLLTSNEQNVREFKEILKNALDSTNNQNFSKIHLHINQKLLKGKGSKRLPYISEHQVEYKDGSSKNKKEFNDFLKFYKFKIKFNKNNKGEEPIPIVKEINFDSLSTRDDTKGQPTEKPKDKVIDDGGNLVEEKKNSKFRERLKRKVDEYKEEFNEENNIDNINTDKKDEEKIIDIFNNDDNDDNDDNDNDTYKTIEAKLENDPVTKEQIESAKKWFYSSPISKVCTFEEAFNTTHKVGVAQWTINGIVLMNGSDYTDLYHESWHAFSQLYLTKQQKKELYDQVRNKKGTFKDHHNNIVEFAKASDIQIEEYLAEGFRSYMLKGTTKETGKIKAFFKKILDILKYFFSKKAIMTPEKLFEKLRNNDIAEFTADRNNVLFGKLFKSIELIGDIDENTGEAKDAGTMSSKDSMDISNLMNIYISDYPAFLSGKNQDKDLIDYYDQRFVKEYYALISDGLSEDEALETVVTKRFEPEDDDDKKDGISLLKKMINCFEKSSKNIDKHQNDLNSISELMSNKNNIMNAYNYALTRLYKLLSQKRSELNKERKKKNSSALNICKLKQQIETIIKAIKNFGNIGDINYKSKTQGVVSYHYNEFFGDIEYDDIAGEDITEETEDDANYDPETGHSENKCNSQSAEQRMKNDQLMKFILSTLPSYSLSRGEKNKKEFYFTPDYDDYGERKIKQFKLIKNRLTTILQGCTGPMDIYNRLCSLAYDYEGDKKVGVYDPVLDAIIQRLGRPGQYINEKDTLANMEKDLLWNRFWQVFACPEVPPIEVNITYDLKDALEDGQIFGEKEVKISTVANEMTGPYWKLDDYYRTQFLKSDNKFLKRTQNGYGLDLEKIMLHFLARDDKNTGGKAVKIDYVYNEESKSYTGIRFLDEDDNEITEKDTDIEDLKENIFDLISALGLSITPNKLLNDQLKNEISDIDEFYIAIRSKIEELLLRAKNNESDNTLTDPISHFWKDYKEGETDLKPYYNGIKKLDIQYVENINTEMVRNAEGSVMFMNQLNNSISQLLNRLNKCKTYADVLNDPALRHLDVRAYIRDSEGKTIPNPKCNYNAKNSRILELMFPGLSNIDDDIYLNESELEKIGKNESFSMRLVNLSGVKVINKVSGTTSGQSLFSADKNTKVLSDLVLMSNGLQEFMRHADKGVSYGLQFFRGEDGPKTIIDNDTSFDQAMFPYIEAEIARVIHVKKLIQIREESKGNIVYDHKYLDNPEVIRLGVFEDMLSKDTVEKIQAQINKCVKNGKSFSITNESHKDIENDIREDLGKYFEAVLKENKKVIVDALNTFDNEFDDSSSELANAKKEKFLRSIINSNRDAFVKLPAGENALEEQRKAIESMSLDNMIESVAKHFTIQNSVYNIECIKIIYGDVMIYNHKKDDFTKRIGGMGSSGSIFNIEDWMEKQLSRYSETSYVKRLAENQNDEYTDPFLDRGEEHVGELKTAICSDVFPLSAYAKNYKSISSKYGYIEEESNAQGLIAFDSYRYLCIRQGKWDKTKEALFQKICNGDEIDPKDVVKYFPILKLQYEGPIDTGDMPLQAFHKYALMPIVPTMVKNRNIEKVHKAMMREGIDYITFNSAAKLAVVSNGKKSRTIKNGNKVLVKPQYGDILYDESTIDKDNRNGGNRQLNPELLNSTAENPFFTPNYIPLAYMKDQVLIHDELDVETIFSTQMRRLIGNNLYINGYPVKLSKEEKWTEKEWDSFTEDQKLNASPAYRAVKKYGNDIQKLTSVAINKIKTEFGIDKKGNINEQKFLDYIKNELIKKGIPEFAMKNMSLYDLQFSFYSKEVEAVIVGLISKRIIQQHVHGGQYVQVASTLWENPDTTDSEGTNDLRFYTKPGETEYDKNHIKIVKEGEDKVEPATIKIPLAGDFVNLLQSKMFDKDGKELDKKVETLENLNKMLKNQAWVDKYKQAINIVACRIPVQGHNSMEFYRIAEFLAPGSNNIIVCPSELVIKSGGDYDVDKLSTITPNIKVINGELFIPGGDAKALSEAERNELIDKRQEYYKRNVFLINSIKKNLKNIKKYQSGDDKKVAVEFLKKLNKLESDIKVLRKQANNKSNLVDDSERYEASKQLRVAFDELNKLTNSIADKYKFNESDGKPKQAEKGKGISWFDSYNSMVERNIAKREYEKLDTAEYQKRMLNSSKYGLENNLLQSMLDILMMPINYKSLLTPNATDDFTEDGQPANELRKNADYDRFHSKVNEKNPNMHPTRIIEWKYNLEKHDDLNTGKVILGPAAIDNVFAPIAKQVGVFMSKSSRQVFDVTSLENDKTITTEKEVSKACASTGDKNNRTDLVNKLLGKKENIMSGLSDRSVSYQNLVSEEIDDIINDVSKYREQRLLLPYNTKKRIQKNGIYKGKEQDVISLSDKFDKLNEHEISDIISQYINGCVDVAKDAWIRYIQGNREAIPTFMFMIQAGIPKDYVCYFISNPLIVEYINNKIKNKSSLNDLNEQRMINKEDELRANMLGVDITIGSGKKKRQKNKFVLKSDISTAIDDTLKGINETYFSLDKLKAVSTKNTKEKGKLKLLGDQETSFNMKALAHFIEIEDMASAMNSLKLGIRVDAAKANSIYDIVSKQSGQEKINENQRLEEGTVNKVKSESVLSAFFIEDTVYDIFNAVCPTKVDKDVKYVFDNIIVKRIGEMPGDASDAYDRFFNDLKSFLYQMSVKTSTNTSYRSNEINDLVANIEGFDYLDLLAQPLIMNKVSEVYTRKLNSLDRGKIEKSYAYKKYLEYIEVDPENIDESNGKTKKEILDFVYHKFLMLESLHEIGFGNVLFNYNQYDFATRYNIVQDLIAKSNNVDLQSLMIFKKMNIVVKENNTNIFFSEDVDELTKQSMREEVLMLENGGLNKMLNESEDLSDYDKQFIRDVFSQFPQYSLLQSGISSSAKSLNFVFDLSGKLRTAYEERMNDQDKKENIIMDFQRKFLNKYTSGDYSLIFGNNSWDDFNTGEEYSVGNNSGIIYTQSYSKEYRERTIDNANKSDITIAIATDFDTNGEKLTELAANDKYFKIDFNDLDGAKNIEKQAKKIVDFLAEKYGVKQDNGSFSLGSAPIKINVAGNGIYTFSNKGIDQKKVDDVTFKLLNKLVSLGVNVSEIRSGGQTGADEAGLKAGVKLAKSKPEIKVICHSPKGFLFRTEKESIYNESEFKKRFGDDPSAVISKEDTNDNPIKNDVNIDKNKKDDVSKTLKDKVKQDEPKAIVTDTSDEVEVFYNKYTYIVTRDGLIYTKGDSKRKPKYVPKDNPDRKKILKDAKEMFDALDGITPEEINPTDNTTDQLQGNSKGNNSTNPKQTITVDPVIHEDHSIIDGFTADESEDIHKLELKFNMVFNKEQRRAIISISDYLMTPSNNTNSFALINGKAGTGKTTIMKAAIERWRNHSMKNWRGYDIPMILAGAVAHKAKDVLRESMKECSHESIQFDSVASMIGSVQGLSQDKDGAIISKFNSSGNTTGLQKASIIIIDECSMINEKVLEKINSERTKGSKLIFMGDAGQLPPIRTTEDGYSSSEIKILGKKISPVFENSALKVDLLKRERQGENSPILKIADIYWTDEENKGNGSVEKIKYDNEISEDGAFLNVQAAYADNGDDLEVSDNILELYKKAVELQDPDYVQYVVFTNEKNDKFPVLSKFNRAIHNKLFPDHKDEYAVGDIIFFNSQYTAENSEGKKIQINNAHTDVIVEISDDLQYDLSEVEIKNGLELKYKEFTLKSGLKIKMLNNDYTNLQNFKKLIEFRNKKRLEIIEKNNLWMYDREGKKIENRVNLSAEKNYFKYNATKEEKKYLYSEIYKLENYEFANIQFGYAINTHKCQGSTYNVVIVDKNNIDIMNHVSDGSSRNKAMYTALTRSRYITIFVNDKTTNKNSDETDNTDLVSMVNKYDMKRKNKLAKINSSNLNDNNKSNQSKFGSNNGVINVTDKEKEDNNSCPL